MEAKGPFDMEEFVTRVVEPEVNPTVLLLEWKLGFVVGGFADVAEMRGLAIVASCYAADPEKKSFIFSLEPKARRFHLLVAGGALGRGAGPGGRYLVFGDDLFVWDDGCCARRSQVYEGGRDDGSFPGSTGNVCFKQFELWAAPTGRCDELEAQRPGRLDGGLICFWCLTVDLFSCFGDHRHFNKFRLVPSDPKTEEDRRRAAEGSFQALQPEDVAFEFQLGRRASDGESALRMRPTGTFRMGNRVGG
jgi:hypothetical protein